MKALVKKRVTWLSGTCFMTCLLFLGIHVARADNVINSGTTLTINSGMTVFEYGSSAVIAGGVIDNHGTMIIKGDLVNGNITTTTDLGPGTFEFSGTTPQSISGLNIFGNLTLNNATGLTINNDQQVNGTLTLTSGLIHLGTLSDKNLLLGPSAIVSGSPSATAMVVATGTGEFRKEFSGFTSFTYPVGDNTGTAEYSPVTANFTSGTFGTGNYLGVKLKNLHDPDPGIQASDHLDRYWELHNNNISGTISCGLTFTFVDADVASGFSKANLYCVKTYPVLETYDKYVGGNQLTGTVTNFGTTFSRFTGARAVLQANLIVFLEGPYDPSTGLMNNYLNEWYQYIPTTANNLTVYGDVPWSYPGNESFSYSGLPLNIIDWVLVELCEATSPANVTGYFARKAGLLTSDGHIVDATTFGSLVFYNAPISSGNNLYCVVRHRNHLAVMSNDPVTKTGGIYDYNFSTDGTKAYPGSPGFGTKLLNGIWVARAGDAAAEGSVQPSSLYIYSTTANQDGYKKADFNFDGSVQPDDLYLYLQNVNTDSQVPYPAY